MSDDTYSFEQARVRLEEIATQVRRKDVSLEKSLDLLEEGVRLANLATEQIDHTQWVAPAPEPETDQVARAADDEAPDGEAMAEGEAAAEDTAAQDEAPDGADQATEEGADAAEDAPDEDAAV